MYKLQALFSGHQPLQDLEIRVGNSSTDLQRNPLCAWFPGTIGCSFQLDPVKYEVFAERGRELVISVCACTSFDEREFCRSTPHFPDHLSAPPPLVTLFPPEGPAKV
ncbi:hypothetical protein EVAR_54898_1 [Eumeta japonica]|uniref:Uncharacterized protein n=1 Tax=Eumeta variegata TaxID=151549 RepID=A0A4C2ACJ1_EUMVA|nr:hypothetical protein EVAR_54898_1 [Eumeta japonica]